MVAFVSPDPDHENGCDVWNISIFHDKTLIYKRGYKTIYESAVIQIILLPIFFLERISS